MNNQQHQLDEWAEDGPWWAAPVVSALFALSEARQLVSAGERLAADREIGNAIETLMGLAPLASEAEAG